MSKTFENNAQKALDMASGIKKHLSEVAHLGIKTEKDLTSSKQRPTRPLK